MTPRCGLEHRGERAVLERPEGSELPSSRDVAVLSPTGPTERLQTVPRALARALARALWPRASSVKHMLELVGSKPMSRACGNSLPLQSL